MTSSAKKGTHTSVLSTSVLSTSFALTQLRFWVEHTLQTRKLKRSLARERRQLADLSVERLKDIRVSRLQAMQEAQRQDIPHGRKAHFKP